MRRALWIGVIGVVFVLGFAAGMFLPPMISQLNQPEFEIVGKNWDWGSYLFGGDYVDIEMDTDVKILDEIIKSTSQNEINLIFSYHNFERTLTFDEAINLIRSFNEKLKNNLSFDLEILEGSIYKVIFSAQTFEDNLIPLKLCKEFANSNQKIISFCMGPLGMFSRITCVIAGSFLTYAYLEEKTALGQINIEKMREFYDLILKK